MSKLGNELRLLRNEIAILWNEVAQLRHELATRPIVVQPAWIPAVSPMPMPFFPIWTEPMKPYCAPLPAANPPHWPTTICNSGDAVLAASTLLA